MVQQYCMEYSEHVNGKCEIQYTNDNGENVETWKIKSCCMTLMRCDASNEKQSTGDDFFLKN